MLRGVPPRWLSVRTTTAARRAVFSFCGPCCVVNGVGRAVVFPPSQTPPRPAECWKRPLLRFLAAWVGFDPVTAEEDVLDGDPRHNRCFPFFVPSTTFRKKRIAWRTGYLSETGQNGVLVVQDLQPATPFGTLRIKVAAI